MMKSILYFIIFYLFPMIGLAARVPKSEDIGQVAQNIMEPVSIFSDFVSTACFVIGAAFLFAAIIKYVEHRRSPLMVPLSTVVFLFIAGIFLLLLPLVYLLTENGVPYSLLK